MRIRLPEDLTVALGARDRITVTALRSALAAIENAEALPADHRPGARAENEHVAGAAIGLGSTEAVRHWLTDAELRSIVENEVRERLAAAQEYQRLGRGDLAEPLRAEAAVLRRHLDASR